MTAKRSSRVRARPSAEKLATARVGRQPLPDEERLEVVPVRLNQAQKAKLRRIGVQRLRDWLDRVKEE